MRGKFLMVVVGAALGADAQGTVAVPFTEAQASQGRTLYARECASCHGRDLTAGSAAPLKGREFLEKWSTGGRTLRDLFHLTRTTMPSGATHALGEDEYLAVTAHVLQENGFASGPRALVADSAVLASVSLQPPARVTAQQPGRRAPDFVPGPQGLVPSTSAPSRAELIAGSATGRDWLMHTRDYAGSRFSPLRQVTAANASRLRVACSFQVGEAAAFQNGPVVHDGTLYLTASLATIAIDAATCRPKWRHEWRATMPGAPTGLANRGVAISEGRVIRATVDGYLVALDASTGRLLWARRVSDASKGELISMPPLIHDDLVYIGTAVSEFAIRGWIAAHRVTDGERAWRFNIVPEPGEPGAETWKQDSKLPIGGGAVWTPLSFDLSRGQLYVPAANPAPDFPVALRGGTNLYTNSLIALDAKTGKLNWYDQLVPLDDHDWDLTQVSPQYRAVAKGKVRDLVATTGKDGHLRVIDRETHERIFETPLTTITNAEAPVTKQGTHACPGIFGGVQWNGSAWYQPGNLLVTPAVDWCATFFVDDEDDIKFVPFTNYLGGRVALDTLSRGWITAVDGSTGSVRWKYGSKKPVVAAVTATAGGVILAGELTGDFLVLDARTGVVRFRHNTGGQVGGGVVTYQVGGTQYIAVASGTTSRYWSDPFPGSPTITVFSLPPR